MHKTLLSELFSFFLEGYYFRQREIWQAADFTPSKIIDWQECAFAVLGNCRTFVPKTWNDENIKLQIALKREETPFIDTLRALRNNKNVKSSLLECTLKGYDHISDLLLAKYWVITGCKYSGCIGLTSITIPNNVTSIEGYTFIGCRSLTSVTIPESVTSIGSFAFDECTSLTNIKIPNSVTSIRYSAFSRCTSLKSFTFPNGITEIEEGIFWQCSSLESVSIPNSVTTIGSCAFGECYNLKRIAIPTSVTTIKTSAFSSCKSLTSVEIPSNVKSIEEYAFQSCTSLSKVRFYSQTPPTIGYRPFNNNADGRKIYVPKESVDKYKNTNTHWRDYVDDIVGYTW